MDAEEKRTESASAKNQHHHAQPLVDMHAPDGTSTLSTVKLPAATSSKSSTSTTKSWIPSITSKISRRWQVSRRTQRMAYYTRQGQGQLFRPRTTQRPPQRDSKPHFLALIGASGSGKSSLMRAGIIPACAPATGASTSSLPGTQPLTALAATSWFPMSSARRNQGTAISAGRRSNAATRRVATRRPG